MCTMPIKREDEKGGRVSRSGVSGKATDPVQDGQPRLLLTSPSITCHDPSGICKLLKCCVLRTGRFCQVGREQGSWEGG
jgi:hypothetical protein